MQFPFTRCLLTLCLAGAASAQAQELATPAEAVDRLKQIVALVKSKGADAAAAEMMAGDPLKCRYKDLGCLVASADAKVLANPSNPSMVGVQVPSDLTDIDGTPIVGQLLGPLKAGKTKWEAKYKLNPPGAKRIVPRWSFCEKLDVDHLACTTITQQ